MTFLFKAEDALSVEKNVGTICLRNIISGEIVRKTQQSAIPSQFNPKEGCRKNDWQQEIPTRSSPPPCCTCDGKYSRLLIKA